MLPRIWITLLEYFLILPDCWKYAEYELVWGSADQLFLALLNLYPIWLDKLLLSETWTAYIVRWALFPLDNPNRVSVGWLLFTSFLLLKRQVSHIVTTDIKLDRCCPIRAAFRLSTISQKVFHPQMYMTYWEEVVFAVSLSIGRYLPPKRTLHPTPK